MAEKSGQNVSAYLNYNFQVATGKAPGPGSAVEEIYIYEDPTVSYARDPKDVLMDYDRTHRLIANVTLNTPKEAWPQIGPFRPLSNVSISSTFRYQSGTPYTDDEHLLGLYLNKRSMHTKQER